MLNLENKKYSEINAQTIDSWIKNGWTWGIPITHEDFIKAKSGEWNVGLTGGKYVPKERFPLESEKLVSARENYPINIVKADMSKKLPFNDYEFDIIFHPVSNCYIEDVYHVWSTI